MIRLKGGKLGVGADERERRAIESKQAGEKRRHELRLAAIEWDSHMAAAHPPVGRYRQEPYPVVTRRALEAWDRALNGGA